MILPSSHPRVLVIEGARYTGRVVARYVSVLNEGRHRFTGMGFRHSGVSRPIRDRSAFEAFHYFPETAGVPRTPVQAVRAAADLALSGAPPHRLSTEPATLKHYLGRRIYWHRITHWAKPLLRGYDLYHWHCFAPDNLPILESLPRGARVLISLWGSDLYRTSGVEEYSRQLAASAKVTAFTMGSVEMRETFLAKFGRALTSKVRLASYGADHLDMIGEAQGFRDGFLRAHGIPVETVTVAIGHNGNPDNQHIAAIQDIAKLPMALRAKLTLLLPLTYDTAPGYASELRRIASAASLRCHTFETFMSNQETAQLRVASDVTVHLPITDQFSAAMCESLAAGSILITGVWLPYSRLRLSGVSYHEVADVLEVGSRLEYVLRNFDMERAKSAGANEVMRRLMQWTSVKQRWLELYDEILRRPTN